MPLPFITTIKKLKSIKTANIKILTTYPQAQYRSASLHLYMKMKHGHRKTNNY